MLKTIVVFLLLAFYSPVFSSEKKKIIYKIEMSNNLSFNFIQTISKSEETGNCIISYPKKIYCKYDDNKKVIISNGKSLVIKNEDKGTYYIYPIEKTPLKFLLDKNYLISKIKLLKPRKIEDRYINFKITEKNKEINVFFDQKTLNITGWQTEDLYQNLTITYISSVKINEQINDDIFKLPKKNK
jgi:outer membrane lipoprotein-sorting protein